MTGLTTTSDEAYRVQSGRGRRDRKPPRGTRGRERGRGPAGAAGQQPLRDGRRAGTAGRVVTRRRFSRRRERASTWRVDRRGPPRRRSRGRPREGRRRRRWLRWRRTRRRRRTDVRGAASGEGEPGGDAAESPWFGFARRNRLGTSRRFEPVHVGIFQGDDVVLELRRRAPRATPGVRAAERRVVRRGRGERGHRISRPGREEMTRGRRG